MQYSNQIIDFLQENDILAKQLDHTLSGVREAVSNQIDTIGVGAQRVLYYTSCFTEKYQDVCRQQKTEDIRFIKAVNKLISSRNIVNDMLKIYFEEIFRYKTSTQLERIKRSLMAVNIHIAASHLTQQGFTLAVSAAVAVGMKASLNISSLIGRSAGVAVAAAGIYGIVQKAADSANRLRQTLPAYYAVLYANELEMMYFLIDSIFDRSGALRNPMPSDLEITDIITNMIR